MNSTNKNLTKSPVEVRAELPDSDLCERKSRDVLREMPACGGLPEDWKRELIRAFSKKIGW